MKHLVSRQSRRHRRGATLVEVITAASMSTMVLFGLVLALLAGIKSWAEGEAKITAESGSQQAIRQISTELRQAMAVTVDVSGNSLTYRLPLKDSNGEFVIPPQWDFVNRRIFYSSTTEEGNTIKLGPVGAERTIARNVILQEPYGTNDYRTYKIFNAGAGSITRQVTVMLVTQTNGTSNAKINSRIRETIYLRNIPVLTQ